MNSSSGMLLNGKEGFMQFEKLQSVRWCGHVLRQSKEDALMKVMVHEVDGKRKQG